MAGVANGEALGSFEACEADLFAYGLLTQSDLDDYMLSEEHQHPAHHQHDQVTHHQQQGGWHWWGAGEEHMQARRHANFVFLETQC